MENGGVCLRNPLGYDWDLHQEKNQVLAILCALLGMVK